MKFVLIEIKKIIEDKWPLLYNKIEVFLKKSFAKYFGLHPRVMRNEISVVNMVLYSSKWNMTYGKKLIHEELEQSFAEYVGTRNAVALGSGGVSLQLSFRALGLKYGDEVIHQVDSCGASALAVIAAGCVPVFSDSDLSTFMLDSVDLKQNINVRTRAVLATHMWGNPENINVVKKITDDNKIILIEDSCLSLGAKIDNKMVGSIGKVGIFSFGCLKPIQTGEGGMVVTDDDALAKEIRSLRNWGDRTAEYHISDTTIPSWNGRMSEILAAVALEQLKSYPVYLENLRSRVFDFKTFLERNTDFQIITGYQNSIYDSSFSQVVVKINTSDSNNNKHGILKFFTDSGIIVRDANFKPINDLTLFKSQNWKEWVLAKDKVFIEDNYRKRFINANIIYESLGIGFDKKNFTSNYNFTRLIKVFKLFIEQRLK